MLIKEIDEKTCDDWEDATYFIHKMINKDGGCMVKILQTSSHGYKLVFYKDAMSVDERI